MARDWTEAWVDFLLFSLAKKGFLRHFTSIGWNQILLLLQGGVLKVLIALDLTASTMLSQQKRVFVFMMGFRGRREGIEREGKKKKLCSLDQSKRPSNDAPKIQTYRIHVIVVIVTGFHCHLPSTLPPPPFVERLWRSTKTCGCGGDFPTTDRVRHFSALAAHGQRGQNLR